MFIRNIGDEGSKSEEIVVYLHQFSLIDNQTHKPRYFEVYIYVPVVDFNGADVEPRAKFEIFRKTSLSISNCNINCGIRIYGFHLSHHLNYCRLHLSSGSAWSFRSFICLKIFALFEAAYGSVFVSTNVLDGTVETALLALLLLLSAADDDDDAAAAIMPSFRFFAAFVAVAYIDSKSPNLRLAFSPVGWGTMFRPVFETNAQYVQQ